MKQQIEKDSLAAAKVRFWGELRDLGLSQNEKEKLLQEFEKWYARSLDYDLAADRVLEKLVMSGKKSMSFKEALNSIGKKYDNDIEWNRLFGGDGIRKFFGFMSDKEKLTQFIDKMFNEGKREDQIVNAIALEAHDQMGEKFDSRGMDKVRLWVLEEKVKLKIGNG